MTGESTKYHEAAKGIEGQRIAAGSFNDVTGADDALELVAASPPNVFGNISDRQNQNEANLLANSQGSAGADLSFGSTATAQRLSAGEQKAAKAKEDSKKFQDQAFRNLLWQVQQMREQRDWHRAQANELRSDIALFQDYVARLHRGEEPKLNPDGSLADPRLEKRVREAEQRTGRKIDRTDANEIETVVVGGMRDQLEEHDRKAEEIDRDIDRAISGSEAYRSATPAQRAQLFKEEEAIKGGASADLALRHVEDDQAQVDIVTGQGLDAKTKAATVAVARTQDAASFFADAEMTDETDRQVGSRNAGEVSGQFALAAPPKTKSTEPKAPATSVEDKPFTAIQQMNG